MPPLTEEQTQRYSRQILLKEIGVEGQEKLMDSRVLVIGVGGLGCPAATYLCAAGVGTIGLMDGDLVDVSNLQRQVLHSTADVGHFKVISAAEKLRAINPHVSLRPYPEKFTANNAQEVLADYDFVVEATDSIAAKFLINDACVMAGKPFCSGALLRFQGQVFTWEKGCACLRCVYGDQPPAGMVPTCAEAGVLGAVAGMAGTMEAAEAIKYLCGIGKPLTNRLMMFDALTMDFQTIETSHNEACPLCGHHPTITTLTTLSEACPTKADANPCAHTSCATNNNSPCAAKASASAAPNPAVP